MKPWITLSARRGVARLAALSLIALAACEHPTEVAPGTLRVPTGVDRTLTGAQGTPVFPIAPPGESQASGDARGLNNVGQVTGAARGLQTLDEIGPYRFTPGAGTVEITGGFGRFGSDINDAGTVVGTLQPGFDVGSRGFVATGNTMVTLGILPGADRESNSQAVALNNAGTIAGYSPAPDFTRHAVIWSPSGAIQDLGIPGSEAIDINASGQVLGSGALGAAPFFLWSPGIGVRDLSAELGALTSVVELNDAGQIVGTFTAAGGASHAFLYTPGSGLQDLGTLGGATSAPTGLNNKGQVVGTSLTADGAAHAFLWTPTDGMEDVTVTAGLAHIRRLNDNLQTLTGAVAPTASAGTYTIPRLVQLQVTQGNTPPQALFSVTCNGLTCTLDATGSLDDKPGLSYAWDLGKAPDGSATGAVVTTTYPHDSPRTVTLTVTDAGGKTSTLAKTFTVSSLPLADFTASCTDLTCTFDRSATTDDVNINITYWWFGDSQTGAGAVDIRHTYAQAGTYEVTMQVLDANKRTATITKSVTVGAPPANTPPVASFTAVCDGLVCTLDASASTDDKGIVSYSWDLNKYPDGTATGKIVVATYPHAGTRTVTLTVTDAEGLSHSASQTLAIGAPDALPVASFTWSCPTLTCTFDASSSSDDNGIVSFDWNLDKYPDGTATGVTTTATYPHSGPRNVTLTVTDTKGQKSSVTHTITIP